MLRFLFWASLTSILYAYVGYPIFIYLWARIKPVRIPQDDLSSEQCPSVTVLIPAHNEERWIRRKIENTLALDYPRERMRVVVASDGSADRTVEIAREFAAQGVEVVAFPQRLGKPDMLNRLVPAATGEIAVMTDANALLEPDALDRLVRHFADPKVGCVTGRRLCIVQQGSTASVGESLYWRYDSWIKEAESRVHSCLGAGGQLYAVRRAVFPHVERVGEDFYIPMKMIAATALRVVYDPEAIAYIPAAASLRIEQERKTRAHVSFLLTLPLLKGLLLPGRSPVWWQFLSHHVLRMFVPLALVGLLASALALTGRGSFYWFAVVAQGVFYAQAGAGWLLAMRGRRPKVFYVPFYFVFANLAVAVSWLRWPVRKYDHAWQRTERLLDPN